MNAFDEFQRGGFAGWLPFLRVLAGIVLLLHMSLGNTVAAAAFFTMDLLGKKYDVYQIPSGGIVGPNIKALNNRVAYDLGPFGIEYVATAVGEISGDAITFSPTSGTSILIPNQRAREFSRAEDISDSGVVIGWHHEVDRDLPPRAFIFSNAKGLQYLDTLFRSVKALGEQFYPPGNPSNARQYGTKGYRINTQGVMIIESLPHGAGTYYRVGPDGGITPLISTECQRFDLNNSGRMPPPGPGPDPCAWINTLINDDGAYAGGSVDGYVMLNGGRVAGSLGSGATSLNNFGYVGAGPATIFTPGGGKIDLLAELLRQVPDHPLAEEWRRPGISSQTFINDAGDISWANLFFTPSCANLTLSLSGTGFEIINGKLSVRVGRTYTVTTRVVNSGRAPARNIQVERPPGPKFFRILSGPTPGIPAELGPGESAQWTVQLKAIGPGSYSGTSYVRAESECGRIVLEQPVATEFVGIPEKIVVNSAADRARKPGEDCCRTGELLPNGDPECTLRAAIEAINAGCGDLIEFNVPDVQVPKIAPASPLPALSVPVVLDGTTQSGGWVELDGSAVNAPGLDVQGGESTIRGFVIHSFAGPQSAGIRLRGPGRNAVVGNRIGSDVTGNAAKTNSIAILVDNSSKNQIGGAAGGELNIIAGTGVVITEGDDNEIVGNRIGLGVNGTAFPEAAIGIAVSGGRGTRIGGIGSRGNWVSCRIGIFVRPFVAVEDLVIEGNSIGLEATGTSVGATAQDRRAGILLFSSDSTPLRNARILSNQIAGHSLEVGLLGDAISGAVVENNGVGLAFTGSGHLPTGISAAALHYGIRLDRVVGARVSGNIVAGHRWDILLAGSEQFEVDPTSGDLAFSDPDNAVELDPIPSPVAPSVIEKNTVGLNQLGEVPPGVETQSGITVFGGAQGAAIRDNVVAGHADSEVWLVDGADHIVAGNRLGTQDGIERGSQTGLLIDDAKRVTVGPSGISPGNTMGRNAIAGIHLRGAADDLLIRLNQIGTDPGTSAAWPNQTGIKTGTDDALASASGLRIEQNVIGGNDKVGVELMLTNRTILKGNRIGVSGSGLPLPNLTGVAVASTPVSLIENTVARNGKAGIVLVGTAPALIQGGPIYENGTGLGLEGILYETPPFPSPPPPLILRTSPAGEAKVDVLLIADAAGGEGEVEIEIFGNRASESQGRTPLIRRKLKASEPILERMEVEPSSAFAVLESFTATVTRDGRTSEFSLPSTALSFELTKPRVVSVSDNELTLQWPGWPIIVAEQSDTPTGPWELVTTVPVVGPDGMAVLTLPIEAGSKFIRLRLPPL
jgi:hypothetical protein